MISLLLKAINIVINTPIICHFYKSTNIKLIKLFRDLYLVMLYMASLHKVFSTDNLRILMFCCVYLEMGYVILFWFLAFAILSLKWRVF
jgi:hypothetical protein